MPPPPPRTLLLLPLLVRELLLPFEGPLRGPRAGAGIKRGKRRGGNRERERERERERKRKRTKRESALLICFSCVKLPPFKFHFHRQTESRLPLRFLLLLLLLPLLQTLLLLARHHEQRQHADQHVLDRGIVVHHDRHPAHVGQKAHDAAHHVLAAAQPALPARVEGAVVAPVVVPLGEQEGASRRLLWGWWLGLVGRGLLEVVVRGTERERGRKKTRKERKEKTDFSSFDFFLTFVSGFPLFSFMLSALPVTMSSPPSWTLMTRWTIGMSVFLSERESFGRFWGEFLFVRPKRRNLPN